ncbi:transposon Ty3-I Gag-Pol polyprotein [Trichonephila clavata]|uniref:Transposon Ty3-I Gag-Pol polyprotein n=1 Tax=Trichonephila clavata TaxID=2740835 RepID=A0A8X6L9G0_TRICU|nr:transposon Ty3-I Gag-Pol polyprotein [Trichonephila clavata]
MLVDVLQEHSEAFKERKNGTPKITVKHRINTGDNLPVKQRAYRVSPAERRIIHDEVGKMLDRGIIQPSESPWSSPVILVRSTSQELLKNDSKFTWGSDQNESFEKLKRDLTSESVLGLFDEKAPTKLLADASGYGIGAVLVWSQKGKEKVIAYASRTLTKAEGNYLTTVNMKR